MSSLLHRIEATPAHSLAARHIARQERAELARLLDAGLVRRMRPRGRWPLRYVVTVAGSYALGTFASDA